MAISAVVNTYNEAEKIKDCLLSIEDWVDEILVVDMGSKDKTLEIVKKFKAKILRQSLVPCVELIRNWGIEKAKGDWILVLDPDERIPTTLAERLQEVIREEKFSAVAIPRKNIIFGKWIRHTNWWPDYQIRFFKKGKVFWSGKIHSYPEVRGEILKLEPREELAIEHLNYQSVSQFLERQNRYSEIAARERMANGENFSLKNFFWKPLRVFLQRYIRHAGFLDGFYGLALSILASYAQFSEEVKVWEKTKLK